MNYLAHPIDASMKIPNFERKYSRHMIGIEKTKSTSKKGLFPSKKKKNVWDDRINKVLPSALINKNSPSAISS